jgi:hypothetical protein
MVAGEEREFRISKKAEKFIRCLPEKERKSVKESIRKLINRDTQGLDIRRYLPYPNEFRLRVAESGSFSNRQRNCSSFSKPISGRVYTNSSETDGRRSLYPWDSDSRSTFQG